MKKLISATLAAIMLATPLVGSTCFADGEPYKWTTALSDGNQQH